MNILHQKINILKTQQEQFMRDYRAEMSRLGTVPAGSADYNRIKASADAIWCEVENIEQELLEISSSEQALIHQRTPHYVITEEQLDEINMLLQKSSWDINILIKGYRISAPPDWKFDPGRDEWEMLQSMLHQLAQAPRQTENTFPILAFIEYLAAQKSEIQNELRTWINATGEYLKLRDEDINRLRKQVQQCISTPNSQFSHLLVQLRPRGTDLSTFMVRAWLAFDYTGDKNYDQVDPIEFENGGEEQIYTLDNLPMLLEDLLSEVHQYLWDKDTDFSIQFFVPRELLNYTIEHWEIQDPIGNSIRIGTNYTVVIRSHERLSPRYVMQVWRSWKQSWDHLMDLSPSNLTGPIWFCNPEHSEHKKLYARLILQKTACVLLTFVPALSSDNRDVFATILGVGTPVALWPRQCSMEPADVQREFEMLVEREYMRRLPNLVRDKRLEAVASCDDDHIGHHLTLLWEDPYLLPPEIFPKTRLRPPVKRGDIQ